MMQSAGRHGSRARRRSRALSQRSDVDTLRAMAEEFDGLADRSEPSERQSDAAN